MLFCALLHLASLALTCVRPANVEKSLLRPSSFQEYLSDHIMMLYGPLLPHFLWQESWSWFEPYASFSSSYSCLTAHFFQYTDRAHLHQHVFNVSWAHKPHVNSCLITENQCVPLRPFLYPDHESHTSLPRQVLPPVSTSELLECASSTLLFVH